MDKPFIIIDFDSTFITVEALDELANIALQNNPKQKKILEQVKDITNKGMEGKISFSESLAQRLSLFGLNRKHIKAVAELLKDKITPSFRRNKDFFHAYGENVYIISGGFKEYILPVATELGIHPDHILANEFTYDPKGNVSGYDKQNVLSQTGGKIKAVQSLKLKGQVYILGDGFTDYEIKREGLATSFVAFTENIERKSVIELADKTVKNMDEFLFTLNLPRAFSYPKSKIKVLLLENIHPIAAETFIKEGYAVETRSKALSEEELIDALKGVTILGIRSKTKITKKVLDSAPHLLAIGAFVIGINQIDLKEAAIHGVAVFNAPYSSTRSVAELVLGEIIMLNRKAFDKSMNLHQGNWDKSAGGSHEIRGKKLGIIGYGNIGSQLSVLAETLGMEVYFYNTSETLPLGNARNMSSMEELLEIADIVSLHVDGRESNRNLISQKEFDLMKTGVIFINASRGFVVDIEALAQNIKSGKVAGAAVDVFPKEPSANGPGFVNILQGLPNTILTPHIGAGTEEAQQNAGRFVSTKVIKCINTGSTTLSVSFPEIQLPELKKAHRLIHIHTNTAGILAQINMVLATNNINVEGQYLKTNEHIGYVITDVNMKYSKDVINELKKIPGTIRVRVLY